MTSIYVVAAVFWHEGKFLIGQRRGDDSFAGKWEFPGGKVREGETEQVALMREIREELAVDIHVGKKMTHIEHTYETVHVHLSFYACTFRDGTPTDSSSHQSLAWITPDEVDQYDFLEADRPLLNVLRKA